MLNTSNERLESAVRFALAAGALASLANAQRAEAQEAQQEPTTGASSLEEVTVTGSRIRRVEAETASPVFVLDQSAITQSGVSTLGDLVQRVPAIAGAATNPQVNNGGGTGESNVELRGLGAQRTLVLLNGRRIGILGNTTTSAVDINMIPINMIERVEVLKEGAGAIYGSDAIAGVVNFITRKDFEGLEVGIQAGQTAESDGDNRQASVMWGNSSERGSIIVGGNWNQQDGVSAADRDFSKFALYLYGGVITRGGSSRAPTGRINLPAGSPLATQFGCGSITRIADRPGTSLGDYRCFRTADSDEGPNDFYNFQPFNLLITPQERGNLFTSANFKIADWVESYVEAIYSRTNSSFVLASLPFDATQDDVPISAQSIYNPFGINFGGGLGFDPNTRVRLEALGNRRGEFQTGSTLANAGFRGQVPNTQWQWDLNAGYGRMDQNANTSGYLYQPALRNALGPSFVDAGGTPRCGTPAAPISGCTPINIFNVQDPAQIALLRSIESNYRTDYTYRSQSFGLNFNGPLFTLPAGDIQAAVGAEYRDQEGVFRTDILTRAQPPLFLGCLLAQETCTGDSQAQYDVTEVYAELFIPLLSEAPLAHALNLSAGIRYSDYSRQTIGSSTNAQFKVEWRPIEDVLVRGSYAEVFRAPTIVDLSLAPTQNAPTFNDPCNGLTQAQVDANPNLALACQNVARDGSYTQALSQITGLFLGNQNLKPETGDVTTFGIVYDPHFVEGLSLTVDAWRYKIDDIITNLDPNYSIGQCVATGAPEFCGLVFRYGAGANTGDIQVFQQPTVNLGSLETEGVDFGVKYALRNTPWGSFNFSVDMTLINSYESIGSPGAPPQQIAGTFDRQFGNYAKWRGLAGLGWSFRGFEGLLTARYVHGLKITDPDGSPGIQEDLKIGSVAYLDLTLGYEFPTQTKVQVGFTNLTDKDPPLLFNNNVLNANTDVSTYDTLGRRYFVGVTQKF